MPGSPRSPRRSAPRSRASAGRRWPRWLVWGLALAVGLGALWASGVADRWLPGAPMDDIDAESRERLDHLLREQDPNDPP